MFKKLFLLSILSLLFSTLVPAQKVILEGVEKAWLRGSGPITQNNEVAGYYFFYALKKKKGKRPYILEFYDKDLNKTATREIEGRRSLYLEQGAYDGENIMLQFYDRGLGEYTYAVYNQEAELLNTVNRPAFGYGNIENMAVEVSETPNTLFATPRSGFLTYTRVLGRKIGYKIEYFNTDGSEGWEYVSDSKSKYNQLTGLLTLNDRVVVNLIGKSTRPNGRKMRYSLLGLDARTGEQRFEAAIQNEQYTVTLINGEIDEESGEMLLFGEYYPLNANQLKVPSLGMFTARIDARGQMSREKYISWAGDVSKFLPVNKRGQQVGKGFTWFHKVIQTEDGRIFAIGEQFRNVVDGAAVAGEVVIGVVAALLGGGYYGTGGNLMKMVVDDLVIYEFSSEFELIDVKVIEKDKVSLKLPGGDWYTTRVLGRQIEAYGLFGYAFAKVGEDGKGFSVGYTDYAFEESRTGQTFFNTLSYQDGEYIENKVEISSARGVTASRVYPAKEGYIMIAEYFKKDKKIVNRLEKIGE